MGSNEQQECIICFENMSDYSVAILSCGHKFHLHCIQGWKNTQGKSIIIVIYVVIVEILM